MKQHQKTKPVENRFNRAAAILRSLRVDTETKELQKDIEWKRHEIEQYGFVFFPNMFVFDKAAEFESLVDELKNHPTTKSK